MLTTCTCSVLADVQSTKPKRAKLDTSTSDLASDVKQIKESVRELKKDSQKAKQSLGKIQETLDGVKQMLMLMQQHQ